jgi:rhodanese-related sulfurtransferase
MTSRPDRIDPAIAYEFLLEGRAVVVDARPHRDYEVAKRRIPAARRVEPGSGAAMDEALFELPRERLVIVYCDEPDEAASAQVARRVRELGLGDASVLRGGFLAWREAGLPTEPVPDLAGPAEAVLPWEPT